MTAPTKKQQELLQFIDDFIKENGYGPSYREAMSTLGYKSVSTVAAHVDALVAKGYLRRSEGYSARSLEVTTPDSASPQARQTKSAEAEIRTAIEGYRKYDTDEARRKGEVLTEALRILGYEKGGDEKKTT